MPEDALFVSISQSGETADTLAALRGIKSAGYLGSMVICNVPESSLVRESNVAFMTRAGPEIGVASTKAFTTQLVVLRLFTLALARRRGMTPDQENALFLGRGTLCPIAMEGALKLKEFSYIHADQWAKCSQIWMCSLPPATSHVRARGVRSTGVPSTSCSWPGSLFWYSAVVDRTCSVLLVLLTLHSRYPKPAVPLTPNPK